MDENLDRPSFDRVFGGSGSIRVVVGIPMYNESPVARLVAEDALLHFARMCTDFKLLVIDDGSVDSTPSILSDCEGLTLIRHDRRMGVGAALASALDFCRDVGASHLVWHVGNGRVSAACSAKLLGVALETGADYVVGSRFARGGAAVGTPPLRTVALKLGNWLVRGFSGVRVSDVTCGVRVVRLDAWDHRLNHEIRRAGYRGEQMMTLAMVSASRRIEEIGVIIRYTSLRPYSHFHWRDVADIANLWLRFTVCQCFIGGTDQFQTRSK